jgi:outer membrane murein-binding lipoprotein Lpp
MAFNKVTWVDREVPYPDRREIHHENGTVETVDIKRDEGTPRVEGTQLNATNFNDLETRIAGGFTDTTNAIDSVSSTVSNLSSTVDGLSGNVSTLSSTVDGLSTTVGTLSGTVNTLSNTVSNLTTTVAGKQDTLTAGTGISIENNVISISLIDADAQEY